jgi:hypothetical protein
MNTKMHKLEDELAAEKAAVGTRSTHFVGAAERGGRGRFMRGRIGGPIGLAHLAPSCTTRSMTLARKFHVR